MARIHLPLIGSGAAVALYLALGLSPAVAAEPQSATPPAAAKAGATHTQLASLFEGFAHRSGPAPAPPATLPAAVALQLITTPLEMPVGPRRHQSADPAYG